MGKYSYTDEYLLQNKSKYSFGQIPSQKHGEAVVRPWTSDAVSETGGEYTLAYV